MIPISNPDIGEDERRGVLEVLESKMLVQGKNVEELERRFAEYVNTDHAIATINGTTALEVSLRAAGLSRGDEVITTPFSFIASSNSILFTGAKPVFVDVDQDTFNINPDLIQEKITDKTKAILPVHLYGQSCEMIKIMKIAEENNISVIEDACQSHGAEYSGKRTGSFGEAGCFSLYATKNMTASEGGIITTNDKGIAEKSRLLRNHGQETRYHHKMIGYNYRMTNIAAAIGIAQMKKLDIMNSKRIENARLLSEGLKDITGIILPKQKNGKHVFHQYTLRITDEFSKTRDEFSKLLTENGVGNIIYYPIPIPMQEAYKNMGYSETLPVTDLISKQVISIPVHPQLSETDIQKIIDVIRKI